MPKRFSENRIAHPLAGAPVYGYISDNTVSDTLVLSVNESFQIINKTSGIGMLAVCLQPITQDELIAYLRSSEVERAKREHRTASMTLAQFLHDTFPARFPAEAEICLQVDMRTFPADLTLKAGNFQGSILVAVSFKAIFPIRIFHKPVYMAVPLTISPQQKRIAGVFLRGCLRV